MFFTQYKALFERHTDAVIVVNAQGFIVEANAAFMALTHWTYADFAAQRYDTFFQLEEHQQIAAYDQRAHIICKDGHAVPVLVQKITADAHAFIIAKDMRALDKIAEKLFAK